MHSVSSINTGALVAGNAAAKSQREFAKSIAREVLPLAVGPTIVRIFSAICFFNIEIELFSH